MYFVLLNQYNILYTKNICTLLVIVHNNIIITITKLLSTNKIPAES